MDPIEHGLELIEIQLCSSCGSKEALLPCHHCISRSHLVDLFWVAKGLLHRWPQEKGADDSTAHCEDFVQHITEIVTQIHSSDAVVENWDNDKITSLRTPHKLNNIDTFGSLSRRGSQRGKLYLTC